MTDDYLKQNVGIFLYELKEKSLLELIKSNKKHNELCIRKKEIYNIIAASLSSDIVHMLEDYNELIAEINAIEQYHLYVQGINDCINIANIINKVSYDDTN